jgi:hypothetical protein
MAVDFGNCVICKQPSDRKVGVCTACDEVDLDSVKAKMAGASESGTGVRQALLPLSGEWFTKWFDRILASEGSYTWDKLGKIDITEINASERWLLNAVQQAQCDDWNRPSYGEEEVRDEFWDDLEGSPYYDDMTPLLLHWVNHWEGELLDVERIDEEAYDVDGDLQGDQDDAFQGSIA